MKLWRNKKVIRNSDNKLMKGRYKDFLCPIRGGEGVIQLEKFRANLQRVASGKMRISTTTAKSRQRRSNALGITPCRSRKHLRLTNDTRSNKDVCSALLLVMCSMNTAIALRFIARKLDFLPLVARICSRRNIHVTTRKD
ncbi:terminase [Salmonella virus STSR3]|nr:terminase [Salmonella virus STSR3]